MDVITYALCKGNGGGSGGGDIEWVKFEYGNNTYSCDHTASEINEALDGGKTVIGIFALGYAPAFSGVKKQGTGGSAYQMQFSFVNGYYGGNKKLISTALYVASSGTVSGTQYNAALSQ